MTERHAVALRAFTIATIPETRIAAGQLLTLDPGQCADFELCGLVRAEADEEAVALSAPTSPAEQAAPLNPESIFSVHPDDVHPFEASA